MLLLHRLELRLLWRLWRLLLLLEGLAWSLVSSNLGRIASRLRLESLLLPWEARRLRLKALLTREASLLRLKRLLGRITCRLWLELLLSWITSLQSLERLRLLLLTWKPCILRLETSSVASTLLSIRLCHRLLLLLLRLLATEWRAAIVSTAQV